MIRAQRIGQSVVLFTHEQGGSDSVTIKDASGGQCEFSRDQIVALRKELTAAARQLRKVDEQREWRQRWGRL